MRYELDTDTKREEAVESLVNSYGIDRGAAQDVVNISENYIELLTPEHWQMSLLNEVRAKLEAFLGVPLEDHYIVISDNVEFGPAAPEITDGKPVILLDASLFNERRIGNVVSNTAAERLAIAYGHELGHIFLQNYRTQWLEKHADIDEHNIHYKYHAAEAFHSARMRIEEILCDMISAVAGDRKIAAAYFDGRADIAEPWTFDEEIAQFKRDYGGEDRSMLTYPTDNARARFYEHLSLLDEVQFKELWDKMLADFSDVENGRFSVQRTS